MKKLTLFIAVCFAINAYGYANASPLRTAVIALHAANNKVQAAVDADACKGGDMLEEEKTARNKLSKRDAKTYDAISKALGKAYTDPAIEPTDDTLERIRLDFCDAVKNR